jgi:hypothetical protein
MAELENDNQVEEQETAQAAPAPAEKPVVRKTGVKRVKTWQEKLDEGTPLTELEDVKSEADYGVRRHLREQKERQAFEARKNRSLRRPINGGNE